MKDLAILWYRGFWDVPRLFCVRLGHAYLLFDCLFSDELDDYEDTFAIRRIDERWDLSENEIIDRAESLPVVARVPVTQSMFDPTLRRSVRMPDELLDQLR